MRPTQILTLAALLATGLALSHSARAGCDSTGQAQFNILIPPHITAATNPATARTISIHNPINSGTTLTLSVNGWNPTPTQFVTCSNSGAVIGVRTDHIGFASLICTGFNIPSGETVDIAISGTAGGLWEPGEIGLITISSTPSPLNAAVNALVMVDDFIVETDGSFTRQTFQAEAQKCY